MGKKSPALVEVTWADSYGVGGWLDPDQVEAFIDQPHECQTLGYLLLKAKDRLVLCMNIGIGGTNHGHLMSIPTTQVRKVRYLK